jgi:small subunit ribosomal protein S6
MREYELTYLVSDEVAEADLKKITDKVAGFITSDGGKISKEESWGRRKLAYPILKQNFATYITIWFETEASKLAELDHELRVMPQVIRHLTTLKVEKSEVLKVTKEDIITAAEDVESVIGEKSFEVVQGETEASKDLMAVREKTDEDEKEEVDEKIDELAEIAEEKAETDNETAEEDESEDKAEDAKVEDKPKKTRKAKITVKEPAVEEELKKVIKPKKTKEPISEEDEAERMKKLDEKLDELLGDDL